MPNQRSKNKKSVTVWLDDDLREAVEEYSRIQKMDRTAAVKFICRTQLGLPVPKEDRSVNFVNGEKVRAARKLNGWTQTDLMKELAKRGWKMSREVMVRIEQGNRFLNDGELKILTDCLGVSPAKLINKK